MLLTTAIDYTNGSPHIGHAYEKVLADVLARYQRLKGNDCYFLTGVDQHGQKVEQTAAREGIAPSEYVAGVTQKFLDLWKKLGVDYDGWAATTDARHIACVQSVLTSLKEKGELYKKAYSGMYSVRQEQFLTDRDREEDGSFGPQWGEVVEFQEENWYFKLSSHTAWLQGFLETHDCVLPHFRKAELINALTKNTDTDLCISRPKNRLSWGIEIPFDTDYVTYVWFDALINYVSFVGYENSNNLPDFSSTWKDVLHVIGKDILVPAHGIYWFCMLHAMGFSDAEMPTLLVHGWWNIRGEKMSKSLGNVVDPNVLADTFGVEPFRYYVMRDMFTGRDSDFDPERLIMLYNTELANSLGNLCNRALNMSQKFTAGILSCPCEPNDDDVALRESLTKMIEDYRTAMDAYDPARGIEAIIAHVVHCNVYAERNEPWKLKAEEQKDRRASILYHLAESVAHCAVLLRPILPHASTKLAEQLNAPFLNSLTISELQWGLLKENHQLNQPSPVFPRIVLEEKS